MGKDRQNRVRQAWADTLEICAYIFGAVLACVAVMAWMLGIVVLATAGGILGVTGSILLGVGGILAFIFCLVYTN